MSIHNLRNAANKQSAADREALIRIYRRDSETQRVALASTEANSSIQTRTEDIIRLAEAMGVKKLGIATCVGLLGESRTLTKILRKRGFDVFGVCCKVAGTKKSCVGITDEQLINFKTGSIMCNPIMQAKLLNRENTELNIVMGLCVGHDSLFLKYAEAPCVSLVIKDRVLGNNPVAALYTTSSFYSKLLEPQTTPSAIEFMKRRTEEKEVLKNGLQ